MPMILAALVWMLPILAIPAIRNRISDMVVRVLTGTAVVALLILGIRWWGRGLLIDTLDDPSFAVTMLALVADSCIGAWVARSAQHRAHGPDSDPERG